MSKRGKTGVSMGSIQRRPKTKVDPKATHCSNCKYLFRGICKKLDEISSGKIRYVSDKNQAKKCKYFLNKNLSSNVKSDKWKQQVSGPRKKVNESGSKSLPIGASCPLYKTCSVCDELKHFTEFQSRGSYARRKKYCRLCKVTGKVPGKSGDPKLITE